MIDLWKLSMILMVYSTQGGDLNYDDDAVDEWWDPKTADFYESLYGNNSENFDNPRETTEHLSSSTEDLKLLFEMEKKLVDFLKGQGNDDATVKKYMDQFKDFNLNVNADQYVKHPVNAFHLMKRTSTYWPKLKKILENHAIFKNELTKIVLPSKTDFTTGAAIGLVNARWFHNFSAVDISMGK